jgi:hypothetical protein
MSSPGSNLSEKRFNSAEWEAVRARGENLSYGDTPLPSLSLPTPAPLDGESARLHMASEGEADEKRQLLTSWPVRAPDASSASASSSDNDDDDHHHRVAAAAHGGAETAVDAPAATTAPPPEWQVWARRLVGPTACGRTHTPPYLLTSAGCGGGVSGGGGPHHWSTVLRERENG